MCEIEKEIFNFIWMFLLIRIFAIENKTDELIFWLIYICVPVPVCVSVAFIDLFDKLNTGRYW